MKKRLLSTLLVLSMVVSLLPVTARAVDTTSLSEPQVTRLTVSWDGGEPVELLGTQPTVSMPVGSKPVFTVKFDKTDIIDQVYVTSTKDGETKYLEAKPQGSQYITDGYFDSSNTNYIPGTIAVTYSKKTVKVDENGNIAGTDLDTLKSQLASQGISSRNETTSADGTVTAQIVLGDMFGAMAGVYFDALVSEFIAGVGIDQRELEQWLGVYGDLSKLSEYDLVSVAGKQFTLYLGDGKDFGDADTYLILVRDATSNKYTKMLLSKAAGMAGLGDISNALSSANLVTKTLLEYNAISEDTEALREEILAHPTMTQQQKAEANAELDALERDRIKYLIGMTAISVILAPVGGAPLMISAILAGYSAIAPYFWEHRVGMIKGCDPIENAFSEADNHGGTYLPLIEENLSFIGFPDNIYGTGIWSVINSGKYYVTELFNHDTLYIGDYRGNGPAVDATLCMHGYKMSLKVYNDSILRITDCKRDSKPFEVSALENSKLIFDNGIGGNISGHGDSEVIINDGKITNLLMAFDSSTMTINGGNINCLIVHDGSTVTINNGRINSNSSYYQGIGNDGYVVVENGEIGGISNYRGASLIINGGTIIPPSNSTYGIINYSEGIISITDGTVYGGINNSTSAKLVISGGTFLGGILSSSTKPLQPVTLLINNDTDITVTGTQAFNSIPTVVADTGYLGGVVYYSSESDLGTPMTIEQAAEIDFTQPYIRIKAADNGGNPGTYTLTVNASPTEGGTVTGSGSYPEGSPVRVTAAPNNGYRFLRWMAGNLELSTNRSYTYTVRHDTELTALFERSSDYSDPSDSNTDYEPLYKITVPDHVTGGTVNLLPTSASKGQRVTLTVRAYAGYVLDTLAATDSKGNTLTLTDKGDGKYTFIMPDSTVSIDVNFKATAPTINFVDVPRSAYYYDAVAWAVTNGITYGLTNTNFGPDVSCTRAQIVSFLWRQAGSPKMGGDNPFTDISTKDYYYDAVLWAVANGITYGSTDTTFSPRDTCTRAQAMTFLYRDKKSPAVSGSDSFTDVPTGEYYADAVRWAVDNGVTAGTTTTTFSPEQDCTRAQIVSFLYRARAN